MLVTKEQVKWIISEFSEEPKLDFDKFIDINGKQNTYEKITLEKFVGFWLEPDYFI